VLAGRRGPGEPVAAAAGVSHKALVPVAGVPMLLRVVRSLRASRSVGRIVISIDDPSTVSGIAELASPEGSSAVELHASLGSPSASVLDCFERLGTQAPLLVTTADHPLLTADMVDHFCAAAEASHADVAVAVVEAAVVRARFPEARRTFIPLRGERVTGANLFALRTPKAARAVAFWRRAERHRKQPWRLIAVFGLPALALFALRRLDLEAALGRASTVIGARIEGVRLPFPECAIDVDRLADLALAEQILAERGG
jgi:GTP:adenosylcobinamide-phosphate guanylyltransferase